MNRYLTLLSLTCATIACLLGPDAGLFLLVGALIIFALGA